MYICVRPHVQCHAITCERTSKRERERLRKGRDLEGREGWRDEDREGESLSEYVYKAMCKRITHKPTLSGNILYRLIQSQILFV